MNEHEETEDQRNSRKAVAALLGQQAATPNGYDQAWVDAINGVLSDRESDVRISDIEDGLWETFIGPMINAIEDHRADVEYVQ